MEAVRLATLAMGTRFELVLLGTDPTSLRTIGEAALERIEETHRAFTRFDPSSLLAHLRRTAPALTPVDSDQFALFADALDVADRSEGCFDPALGRRPFATALLLDRATRRVGLAESDTALDFGAIAKGHAVDLAITVLKEGGVAAAFVHGGASSGFGFGACAGQSGWHVGLGPGPNDPTLTLSDQGFSVAGVLSHRNGRRTPHTVNPRTRRVLRADRRVAVIGPSARLADAWSTAILVAGERPPALGGEWRVWESNSRHQWIEMEQTGE